MMEQYVAFPGHHKSIIDKETFEKGLKVDKALQQHNHILDWLEEGPRKSRWDLWDISQLSAEFLNREI